jgi:small subunit ribosomal protein S9
VANLTTADKGGCFCGTGRRKTAVARVRIKEGRGEILVNKRPMYQYFTEERDRQSVLAPLKTVDLLGRLDCMINISGGGTTGQAEATKLGVARSLRNMNPEYERPLRDAGHLTRDSRMVERKKYGRPGARRSFQFSKR